ncbi:MAG: hypothetical protein IJZ00_02090 [Lachnospiraceae bacterium]|nr:hypothetical protein [Lachnospiraceae bacterium]
MRNSKKKELIECIKTLQKANGKVLKVTGTARADLLMNCQEVAITVGTEIEKIEGEGTSAVSILEQYCEDIYLMSVGNEQGELVRLQRHAKELLESASESIEKEIPLSPAEIVFLPYKASMWDALDSVYRAAKKEENCHVVVMPIPYFNISPAGEVLAVEYEGALFPKDIEITDFRDYNLEAMRPDFIFIHNPYDEYNRVTQVPQQYFSSKLVNYTDHLVYIPYFVSDGEKVKDAYCQMPAVAYAWRTFVQSDKVRECYIKNGAEPKKIVAMGSPKFDMVVKMEQNPPVIPAEWEKALEGRKIFLLNTHLNPIINDAEKTIDKLHQIFELFRERNDVALLWRPHPLSIQTAKSMNPGILGRYLNLVEEFKTLPNGVYDDTPDVHRAIALSDAYIGHGSSLVTMYGITGKPMYMLSASEDANVRIPESEKYLQFACGAIYDGYLWMPAERYNSLFKMNMETGKIEFVTFFEGEDMLQQKMFHKVILHKDKLFFIPLWGKNVIVYEPKTGNQTVVEVDNGNNRSVVKFFDATIYNEILYMFFGNCPRLMCMNVNTYEVKYYTECCDKIENKEFSWAEIFYTGIKEGNTVWLGHFSKGLLIEFNLDTLNGKIIYVGQNGVFNAYKKESKIYVLDISNAIYTYDIYSHETGLLWKQEGQAEDTEYIKLYVQNDNIWLLPKNNKCVTKISMETNRVKRIAFPEKYAYWESAAHNYQTWDYIVKDNIMNIFPANSNMLIRLDLETDKMEYKKTVVNRNVPNAKVMDFIYRNGEKLKYKFYDTSICTEQFINYVSNGFDLKTKERKSEFSNNQKNINGCCGEEIWNNIWRS